MEEKFQNLPLRNGVGIVLLNKENKIFVGKRVDNPSNFWQMPQGGVDNGENFLDAAYRELKEETGIKKNVELIQEIEGTMTYELPDHLLGVVWKGKFKGQKQKWFLMRYEGNNSDINIKTYQTPTMAPFCKDEEKYKVVKEMVKKVEDLKKQSIKIDNQLITEVLTVNGVRFSLADGSWGLIRASSNKPSLVVVTESPTSNKRKKVIFDFIDNLLQETGKIGEYDQKI